MYFKEPRVLIAKIEGRFVKIRLHRERLFVDLPTPSLFGIFLNFDRVIRLLLYLTN